MKITIYEEELQLATPSIMKTTVDGVVRVGLQIGTSEFNQITFWFDSKAALDEWLSNVLYLIHDQG